MLVQFPVFPACRGREYFICMQEQTFNSDRFKRIVVLSLSLSLSLHIFLLTPDLNSCLAWKCVSPTHLSHQSVIEWEHSRHKTSFWRSPGCWPCTFYVMSCAHIHRGGLYTVVVELCRALLCSARMLSLSLGRSVPPRHTAAATQKRQSSLSQLAGKRGGGGWGGPGLGLSYKAYCDTLRDGGEKTVMKVCAHACGRAHVWQLQSNHLSH